MGYSMCSKIGFMQLHKTVHIERPLKNLLQKISQQLGIKRCLLLEQIIDFSMRRISKRFVEEYSEFFKIYTPKAHKASVHIKNETIIEFREWRNTFKKNNNDYYFSFGQIIRICTFLYLQEMAGLNLNIENAQSWLELEFKEYLFDLKNLT